MRWFVRSRDAYAQLPYCWKRPCCDENKHKRRRDALESEPRSVSIESM